MVMAQKALYNSLRMGSSNGSMWVEPWKVEDLRLGEDEQLFERLKKKNFVLDRTSFRSWADQFDTPEEMTVWLVGEEGLDPEEYDQIYLIVFELWRRLMPEKPSISVLCDEVDQQIFYYDRDVEGHFEELQDVLGKLLATMQENVDWGLDPQEVFSSILEYCAHDVERFLYDYIADQIDSDQYDFAQELIDQFYPFVLDKAWFDLLRARLIGLHSPQEALRIARELISSETCSDPLELNFEILIFAFSMGFSDLFKEVVLQTLKLIETEDDFIELLGCIVDFYRSAGSEEMAKNIEQMIAKRGATASSKAFAPKDGDRLSIQRLFEV